VLLRTTCRSRASFSRAGMRVEPGSEVVDGRDHLAGGHVAHRALHRMAVVIEADREQFVLIELNPGQAVGLAPLAAVG
jgi:hypothetical protein